IGILAGSMLLVFGSTTDKAKATKVVSNLRSLKAAALMYYADEGEFPASGDILALENYLDRPIASDDVVEEYGIGTCSGDTSIYAEVKSVGDVQKYLQDMATESGLYNGDGTEFTAGTGNTAKEVHVRLGN
ncbi:MAG: type II secretion system protein, partial [Thermovirgaceae bacterium]